MRFIFPPRTQSSQFSVGWGTAIVSLALLIFFGIWSVITFGGVIEGVVFLSGRDLYLPKTVIDLGALPAEIEATVKVPVHNLSSSPLTLLGARTDCDCTVTNGLPVTILPRARHILEVQLTPSSRDVGEDFSRLIELNTDRDIQNPKFVLTGHVVDAAGELRDATDGITSR